MGYAVTHSPNVRCIGTKGSQGLVVFGWLGSPSGSNGTHPLLLTSMGATGD